MGWTDNISNAWDKQVNPGNYMASPGTVSPQNTGPYAGQSSFAAVNNPGVQVAPQAQGAEGFGGGNMFGMTDSTSVNNKTGAQTTNQGWGGLAMGLGSMYMNWTQGKEQQKFAQDQLDFSKEQFYKNYAMNMDKYRRKVNRGNSELSWLQGDQQGTLADTFANGGYNDGSQMIDHAGNTMADPTHNAVSAFAPTTAGVSPTANALLDAGTGVDGVGVDVESKRRARPAGAKTHNDEASDNEAAAVEASREPRKKKLS